MHISPIILASIGLLASAGLAEDIKWKHFDCGTNIDHGTHHFKQTIKGLHKKQHAGSLTSRGRAAAALQRREAPQPINVDAYFHVVSTADKASQYTDEMAQAQLTTMNAAYSPYKIHFNLKDTSFTTDDAWAVGAGDDDTAMKGALRRGGYAALNLYFQSDLAGNVLGRCSLPSAVGDVAADDTSVFAHDGCNIQAGTMPNGSVVGYNMGKTAVHETGHWLGLLHTFEGYSCDGDGDFIADTPQQSTSTDGCPAKPAKDSCGDQAGVDPIHNYMDYSTDACYTGFTRGQRERIQHMWDMYRDGK